MRYKPKSCFGLPVIGFTFADLACKTWDDLKDADLTGFSIGEESITDYLLLTLLKKHSQEVTVKKFTRRAESINGADWEWWFTNGTMWSGIRIYAQAKRVDVPSKIYKALDPAGAQIQKIINISQKRGIYPLYCFYNFWKGYPTQKYCGKNWHFCGWPSVSKRFWGCAVAPAVAVKKQNSNKLADILNISMPWMCLFCQNVSVPTNGDPVSLPLPARVISMISDLSKEKEPELHDAVKYEILSEPPAYIVHGNSGFEIIEEKYPIEERPDGIIIIAEEE